VPPKGVYNFWQEKRVGSSKIPNGMIKMGFNQMPIGMRLIQKRKGNVTDATVVNVMKKELTKRTESPRSRQ